MRIIIFILALALVGCQEAEKVAQDPKVQEDSENLVQDIIDKGEEILEDKTGIKADIQIPKGDNNAVEKGKK